MKNKFRILKIAITVIIFGFLLSFSLKRFNNKPMDKISINLVAPTNKEKVYFIDEKNVKEFILKTNPSKKIGDIDIPALEKEVNRFPSVDSANVFLNLNGMLNVDIVQKIPAFRLNKNGQDFYVDAKGNEFPISKNYSHPSMLVTGDVQRSEYKKLAELIKKINKDNFSKNYFIGIKKDKGNYNLLTSEGDFLVEIGDLENIDFKVKGFKTFVEKYLVYQNQEKFNKISVKFDNQIITTLNPNYKENDSVLSLRSKELVKTSELAQKKVEAVNKVVSKTIEKAKTKEKSQASAPKTKSVAKPKENKKPPVSTKTKSTTKPKAK